MDIQCVLFKNKTKTASELECIVFFVFLSFFYCLYFALILTGEPTTAEGVTLDRGRVKHYIIYFFKILLLLTSFRHGTSRIKNVLNLFLST